MTTSVHNAYDHCIHLLDKGNINSFFTGSASMSALATTGPGFPPLRIPTPVLAIPVCTSIPERRCAAIFSAVLNSRFQVQDAGESLFSNQLLAIHCLCFALILVF
jgi:hypothetical protein